MLNTALFEFLEKVVPKDSIRVDEPMDKHTTFRVGGVADVFVDIPSVEALQKIVPYLMETEREFVVLGNGSNVLIGDKGYQGVVLHLGNQFGQVDMDGTVVTAQAGAMLSAVAKKAGAAGLTGMEFASGIPGTIGGAIVMNAGAYGGEMQQIVTSVEVMTMEGEILQLDNETMEFSYRHSIIKDRPLIVLGATMQLQPGDVDQIKATMDDLANQRRSKQPVEFPSAGSTFKRPEGYFAGKLIMDAGLRGYSIGGAQVAEKHCGFIINKGNASAADVSELMDEVTEKVRNRFGVTLEPEVIRIGTF